MLYKKTITLCLIAAGILLGVYFALVMSAPMTEAATNLIKNPGVETAGTGGVPQNWIRGGYGTNDRKFTYPVTGHLGKGLRVEIANYTSGDAKWAFDAVAVQGGKYYDFSDYYRSSRESYVTVQFRSGSGALRYLDLGKLAASGVWKKYQKNFYVPSDVVSLTVFHVINGVGYIETDTYSLSLSYPQPLKFSEGFVSLDFDDGWLTAYQNALPVLDAAGYKASFYPVSRYIGFPAYISVAQLLDIRRRGHEIGAHTRTHAHLNSLTGAQLVNEIAGSKQDLQNFGVTDIQTFAYPYGEYNDTVVSVVKNYYRGARTVSGKFNDRIADPYVLKAVTLRSTDSIATVKAWIDEARREKYWLILNFHRVDNTGFDLYTVTPQFFSEVVAYLKATNVPVRTKKQGLDMMSGTSVVSSGIDDGAEDDFDEDESEDTVSIDDAPRPAGSGSDDSGAGVVTPPAAVTPPAYVVSIFGNFFGRWF